MPCSLSKLLLVAALLSPMSALAQGRRRGGVVAGAAGQVADLPEVRLPAAPQPAQPRHQRARTASVRRERVALGAPPPPNVGSLNNSGNEPSGAGNAAKAINTPGTNSAGTANSSGSTSSPGGAPTGSTTVGTADNPAGGATGGRIDGTITQGPAMQGDDAIRKESSEDSKVDKKIKSICKGC